jgi:ATP-binding cassette, subfamily B, bacterial PglK
LTARSSDLLRKISYDALNVTDGMLLQIATLITEFLLLFGVIVVMTQQNPLSILIMIFMLIPVVIIYFYVKKYLVKWAYILQKQESIVIKSLQEGLGGIKDAIISGKRSFFENNFHINIIERAIIKRKRDVALLFPRYLIETLMMLAMAISLLWLEQSKGLAQSLPEIAFLTIVAVRLLPMSNRILSSLNNIKALKPSLDDVCDTLSNEESDSKKIKYFNEKTDSDNTTHFEKLSLNNVNFKYLTDKRVIDNLSITIKKGEMIGLVGGSGAGKTTLVNLILGLLEPNEGSINVNDKNIHKGLKLWQSSIGYVSQYVFLLDGSIIENIAFGVESNEIDIKKVNLVILSAKLDSWVTSLSDGVDSIVGEQGVQISGGQRQRIGIARALYQNPEIFVFDEATSSLDNHTEKEIMDDLYKMQGDRTMIIIAHRLETIRKCDRIIVLENGRVVGDDKYSKLLKNNKEFQKISLLYSAEL